MVDAEQMQLVKRIFYMVGMEGYSIRGVKQAFERKGLLTPDGKRNWATPFIRGCISDDVYKPHTYQEVEPLVSTEVAQGSIPRSATVSGGITASMSLTAKWRRTAPVVSATTGGVPSTPRSPVANG